MCHVIGKPIIIYANNKGSGEPAHRISGRPMANQSKNWTCGTAKGPAMCRLRNNYFDFFSRPIYLKYKHVYFLVFHSSMAISSIKVALKTLTLIKARLEKYIPKGTYFISSDDRMPRLICLLFEPTKRNWTFGLCADSEGPSQTPRMRSLTRAFAVRKQNHWNRI